MAHQRGRPRHPDILTPAEWRVLEQVREGLTNPETADLLGLSVNTVRDHMSNILGKLEVRDRAALKGRPARPLADEGGCRPSGGSPLAGPFVWGQGPPRYSW